MKNSGVHFEGTVLDAISTAIKAEKLGLLPSCCKVFSQKGYFSKDREKDIKTDISVEVFLPNASEPSLIWVWECKDYKKKIPVDDVEEFHAKLEQIGSDKTKGTIVTSQGSFQRSSLKYASSKGIGLARLMPDKQVEWLMYNMLPNMYDLRNQNYTLRALTQTNYKAKEHNFFGISSDSRLTTNHSIENYIMSEFHKLLQKNNINKVYQSKTDLT